jgi:hypothetical protein
MNSLSTSKGEPVWKRRLEEPEGERERHELSLKAAKRPSLTEEDANMRGEEVLKAPIRFSE